MKKTLQILFLVFATLTTFGEEKRVWYITRPQYFKNRDLKVVYPTNLEIRVGTTNNWQSLEAINKQVQQCDELINRSRERKRYGKPSN